MKILAVVVTYNPDFCRLKSVLDALNQQVSHTVLIDNGSSDQRGIVQLVESNKKITCMPLSENQGLGTALNLGISQARRLQADYVLLMDQDSVFMDNAVLRLSSRFGSGLDNTQRIAAIGPRFVDAQKGVASEHVKFELTKIGRIPCRENQPYVSTDFLITSGSLIPLRVLDDVGPMDETLFIDHVDTEWCLRARSKGYVLLGDCEALMEHDLGEYRKRIWFFRWREVPVHKAFRYYYIFRNSFLLYRRKYIPWSWIRIDLIRLIQIFGFTLLFGPDRLGKIAMMFRGVRDAFLGKSGKFGS